MRTKGGCDLGSARNHITIMLFLILWFAITLLQIPFPFRCPSSHRGRSLIITTHYCTCGNYLKSVQVHPFVALASWSVPSKTTSSCRKSMISNVTSTLPDVASNPASHLTKPPLPLPPRNSPKTIGCASSARSEDPLRIR